MQADIRNLFSATPARRCLLLIGMLSIAVLSARAEQPGHRWLTLADFRGHSGAVTLDECWLYSAGDNPAWADPLFDDHAWPDRSPHFMPAQIQSGDYAAVGWFRKHIYLDAEVASRSLFLVFGGCAAAEVYWDGQPVYSLGQFSTDPAQEQVFYTTYSRPLPLPASAAGEHVLAIRYSNHQTHGWLQRGAMLNFHTELQFGNRHGFPSLLSRDIQAEGWTLIMGLSLALAVLHLIVFGLYPAVKENLWFGLFAGGTFLMAGCILSAFILLTLTPTQFAWVNLLYRISLITIGLTVMRFMHEVAGILKQPRYTRLFFLLLAAGIVFAVLTNLRLVFLVNLLIIVELVRSLIVAFRRRVERIWIVAIGLSGLMFSGFLAGSTILGWIPFNPWMQNVDIAGIIILMLSISVYIGAKFAHTNLALEARIEETRRAVRALTESEDRYRSIVENPIAGVGIVDHENKVVYVNDRYLEIIRSRREDVVGHDIRKRITPESIDDVNRKLALLFRGEVPTVTQELEIIGGDGERRTLLAGASLYFTRQGKRHMVVHASDVTDMREAQRKRQEALSLAEQTARMASIGVMAGGITHEINQPLNAIMLHAETLQFMAKAGRLDQTEPVGQALSHIVMGTERISEIVQHMRSFWVSDSSTAELGCVDLSPAIAQGVHLTGQKAQAHAIELTLECAPAPLCVQADPLQLEQIVINLLSNAINALDKIRRPDKRITVRTFAEGDAAVLEVTDNGPGLPAIDPEKLFDPFFSTGKDKGGTGLGLAIVRMFVERFKGTITAENNPTGGATFRVRLPLGTDER